MRNFKIIFCLLAIIIPILSSCSKDDDVQNLILSKTKVDIIVGKIDKVTVNKGNGDYTATSSDDKVATVKVSGKELTITAIKIGSATITVKDKLGKTTKLTVSVIKDPYETIKADAKTRFIHDKISKIEGTDKGVYKLSQASNGTVEFSWKSEDGKSTIVLNFADKVGTIALETKKGAKLVIDGKETKVDNLEVIKNEVVNKGEPATIWIVFKALNKEGVCVGKLAANK